MLVQENIKIIIIHSSGSSWQLQLIPEDDLLS